MLLQVYSKLEIIKHSSYKYSQWELSFTHSLWWYTIAITSYWSN